MKRIALIMVVAVFGTISSDAQITKVDQEVFGMDCAPCAYGLERGLKKMDGLEKVRVSLNDGKAYLELSENNSLSLKQIQEEVKKNGFSAKKAEVVIEGKLIKKNNNFQLHTETETYSLSGDLVSELKPGKMKLKGIVQDEEDDDLPSHWKINIIWIF
ncbi:heavy-metal-associated domain-containing protein [Gramella sp. MT6]|uniref:heavy-metal-associated domain-containing protein n=1 Tax=Gramella sp. MT6 TaxID=2705471 RepID=UPI001C5E36C8|nr:heavy metal-associated domain-containing protein [Gramella sp. MT6]QYA26646.1 heavy-metal-associated domain-containing protein [Gramella sp. MT6]